MAAEKSGKKRAPSECPICGADVPPNALACPDCGADERTGWNEETTRYDGLDLPDAALESDEASQKTRPESSLRPEGIGVFWWMIGLGVLALLIFLVLSPAL